MRTIVIGEPSSSQHYHLEDPDAQNEAEFEFVAAKALTCVYPDYRCVLFGGTFRFYGKSHRPDLALVAKDFSHWFVIEVELVSHSLEGHVLPQARTFRWGEPQADCVGVLARKLEVSEAQAGTLVEFVPRSVAIVANRHCVEWERALSALDVQFLAVSRFRSSASGEGALEISGALGVMAENLGFGTYSAIDRSLLFPRTVRLPHGRIQLCDSSGAMSWWIVAENGAQCWITKEFGTPSIADGAFVQIIRSVGGKLSLRLATDGPHR